MSNIWIKTAQELTEQLLDKQLNKKAIHYLNENKGPWCLACSGGVDSLAMVLWVVGKFGIQEKIILHYNHKMRPEADAEEAFVREVAEGLGVQCVVGKREMCVGNLKNTEHLNEEVLRTLRMEFFKKSMEAAKAKVLITGHHLGDVAETLLMRLTRGSGSQGLSAPRPVQHHEAMTIVRPFLDLQKKELEKLLAAKGIRWCEDSSNVKDIYFRNRVRKEAVPLLEKLAPTDFWKGVQRSRELLEEEDAALEVWLDELLGSHFLNTNLDMEKFLDKPMALKRRLLHRWLLLKRKNLSAQGMDQLLSKISSKAPSKVSCEEGWLVFDGRYVAFEYLGEEGSENNWGVNRLMVGETIYLPSGDSLNTQWMDLDEGLREKILGGKTDSRKEVYVNLEGKKELILIRQWVAGDAYTPLGLRGHSKKLQDMFVDGKIEVFRRHQLPIIINGDEIVWCPGLAINEGYKISKMTKRALRLTFLANAGR